MCEKIICIVQARMGSSRLPGKVMKYLNGKPMIYHTLTNLKKSKYINEIILATSREAQDDIVANYVKSLGFEVFRGSEGNVLKRYKEATDKYNGDIIVRVTGDCPLINPIICDHVITKYLMYDYDYVRLDVPDTFQRGFDTEVFSRKVLDNVYGKFCSEESLRKNEFNKYREHVTYYIYNNKDEFRVGTVTGEGNFFDNREFNLSVDTKEDFKRVESLHKKRFR